MCNSKFNFNYRFGKAQKFITSPEIIAFISDKCGSRSSFEGRNDCDVLVDKTVFETVWHPSTVC